MTLFVWLHAWNALTLAQTPVNFMRLSLVLLWLSLSFWCGRMIVCFIYAKYLFFMLLCIKIQFYQRANGNIWISVFCQQEKLRQPCKTMEQRMAFLFTRVWSLFTINYPGIHSSRGRDESTNKNRLHESGLEKYAERLDSILFAKSCVHLWNGWEHAANTSQLHGGSELRVNYKASLRGTIFLLSRFILQALFIIQIDNFNSRFSIEHVYLRVRTLIRIFSVSAKFTINWCSKFWNVQSEENSGLLALIGVNNFLYIILPDN